MQQQGTILVAEDNEDDYMLIDLACRRAGMHMPRIRVGNGIEAQDYLRGTGAFADRQRFPLPHLVLSDLKMPRMNGLELLGWLRSQPLLKRIPFVLLTASSQQSDVNQAYDLGVNSFLVKPITLEELTHLLVQVKNYWLDLNRLAEMPANLVKHEEIKHT